MRPLDPATLGELLAARERIADSVLRTPIVPLNVDDAPARIFLKLENLQPIGSFKLRGSGNAIRAAGGAALRDGVYTASAGNMAQGVAWHARRLGIPCHVIVPDHAPRTKLDAIARLGGQVIKVPFDAWWRVIVEHEFAGLTGTFIHPVSDPHVVAGNGTIGLEAMEDLPALDAIVVPYGGGGLSCGIASAVRAQGKQIPVYAAEMETAAPFAAALAAGRPTDVEYTVSFVDGVGGRSVLEEMWPMASSLLAGSLVVGVREVAAAVRLLVERNRVVAEGAGATSVAAALSGQAGAGNVLCIVSGGNIDTEKLCAILRGDIP